MIDHQKTAYMAATLALSELFEIGAEHQPDQEYLDGIRALVLKGEASLIVEAEYSGRDTTFLFYWRDAKGDKRKLFAFQPTEKLSS